MRNRLGKICTSKWREFKSPISDLEQINIAARWHYQRDRVFVRSRSEEKDGNTMAPEDAESVKRAETIVIIKAPKCCPDCGKQERRKSRLRSRTVQDLVFGRGSVKGRACETKCFRPTAVEVAGTSITSTNGIVVARRKWGWNLLAYFVYHIVGLRVPQLTVQHSLNRLFGFDVVRSTLNNLKIKASDYYSVTKRKILEPDHPREPHSRRRNPS